MFTYIIKISTENTNPVNTCPDFLITEEEVKDQLDILNCTKPSGPDDVAPRINLYFYKQVLHVIVSKYRDFYHIVMIG
jgi:hypothetical protein